MNTSDTCRVFPWPDNMEFVQIRLFITSLICIEERIKVEMEFAGTPIEGLKIVEPRIHTDDRGSFVRAYCAEEFKQAGISCDFVQDNLSFNHRKNTIRGMHWQKEPFGEDKLVRCIAGAIYDVAVDLRKDSSTYGKWFGIELSAENHQALFIPKGFAHGYQTLEDDTAVYYKVSQAYHPESGAGVPHNDKKLQIKWKELDCECTLSEQDRNWERL